jgi:hypothetical protein
MVLIKNPTKDAVKLFEFIQSPKKFWSGMGMHYLEQSLKYLQFATILSSAN